MRSTFAGLNTTVRGLYAQQLNLDTMGHNISNTNTEGYSRQRVNLMPMPSENVPGFYGTCQVGAGANADSIMRTRDHFIDQQFWKQNSTLQYANSMSESLSKIEEVFKEPSDTGLQSVMNKFWNSWQSLSVNAADYGNRAVVKAGGAEVVNSIQLAASQIKENIADSNSVVKIKVAKVNQINSEIYALNKQIVQLESTGDHANDLRDRRDQLTNELSSLTRATVTEDSRGNYIIQIDGNEVVSGLSYSELETRSTKDAEYGFEIVNVFMKSAKADAQPIKFNDGELQATLDARDDGLVGAKHYLDQLVTMGKFFLTEFNEVHRKGLGTDNTNNNNFFGNLKNADGSDYDYKSDPDNIVGNWTNAQWLSAFETNTVLDTTEGLGKIAAKTSIFSDIMASIAEPTSVTTTGTYDAPRTKVQITSTMNGDTKKYSASFTDKNGNPKTVDATYAKGTLSFTVNGMTIDVAVNEDAIENLQYEISAAGSVSVLDSAGNPITGSNKIKVKPITGDYTGGKNSTKVKVEKELVGGLTKYYYTAGDDGQKTEFQPGETLTIAGLDLTIDVSSAIAYGSYTFTLSKDNNASGDNAVNLANRLKNDTSELLGNASLESYYSSIIADLGVRSQNSIRTRDNQEDMVAAIINRREGICGVSIDEEFSDMVKFSKAYSASSRVLTTLDEMLDKLINSTGTVGR